MSNKLPAEAVVAEFSGVDLNDKRLSDRLSNIAATLARDPAQSFPKAFASEAALEGFYRFVRNPFVTFEDILASHIDETLKRASPRTQTLAIHDTSVLSFGDARSRRREGLGRINRSDQGMLMHAALLVSDATTRDPLGLAAAQTWTRGDTSRRAVRRSGNATKASGMALEHDRWSKQIEQVESRASRGAFVHLLDSEGDDFSLLATLRTLKAGFVIRSSANRRLSDAAGTLNEAIEALPAQHTYTIDVCSRGRPIGGQTRDRVRNVARDQRRANVSISATGITLKRPRRVPSEVDATCDVNVVRVWEQDPPADAEPVCWVLLTSEPVATVEQMLAVVNMYRTRWIIEEFFKALKTGCAYEARQLDSEATLTNALAIMLPIAWLLLRLRTLQRTTPDTPATEVLSSLQLKVLRINRPKMLSATPTVNEAMLAIASMGGHIKNNGAPGWQVILRGYVDLMKLVDFAELAEGKM